MKYEELLQRAISLISAGAKIHHLFQLYYERKALPLSLIAIIDQLSKPGGS